MKIDERGPQVTHQLLRHVAKYAAFAAEARRVAVKFARIADELEREHQAIRELLESHHLDGQTATQSARNLRTVEGKHLSAPLDNVVEVCNDPEQMSPLHDNAFESQVVEVTGDGHEDSAPLAIEERMVAEFSPIAESLRDPHRASQSIPSIAYISSSDADDSDEGVHVQVRDALLPRGCDCPVIETAKGLPPGAHDAKRFALRLRPEDELLSASMRHRLKSFLVHHCACFSAFFVPTPLTPTGSARGKNI